MVDRGKIVDRFTATKQALTSLTVITGGFGSLATAVSFAIQDPYWIIYSLSLAESCFILGIVASYSITEEVPASLIILDPAPDKTRRKSVPAWLRNFFIVAAIIVGCGIATVFATAEFTAVGIGKIDYWMPQHESVAGKEYRSGMLGSHDGSSTSFFFPGPYYLTFAVQKAKRHKRVDIDGITVTVLEYHPPTPKEEIQVWTSLPMDQETLLLVEIDGPQSGKSEFKCNRVFERDNGEYISNRFVSTYIDHDNPETIVAKIDAKHPGLYKFKVELDVSVGLTKSKVLVQTDTVYYPPEKKPANGK